LTLNNFNYQGAMIAWNGCEKIISKSRQIVEPEEQNKEYLYNLEPMAKCELGTSISADIKAEKIKIKQ
jgi:hypothetical protein